MSVEASGRTQAGTGPEPVAVVGMAGRFPGASSVEEFWQNLCSGVESVTFWSDDELAQAGVDGSLLSNPAYVKAGAIMEGSDMFDAGFFGYSPREAELLDPQQRVLLECAWEALEDAGVDPDRYAGSIGIWAGCGMMSYYVNNLAGNPRAAVVGSYQTLVGNVSDFAATRVAYKLNLRGPSFTVLSACSSSLVAVHVACTNLQTWQCDIALAGGVSLRCPQKAGYLYQEGMIMSPDGHCRAFDEDAGGIVAGEGVGLVVLKRLSDARADGDFIHAVILGSAVNNDGSSKAGFTAPSVDGQASVIRLAQELAGIQADSIGYVEAHGTATRLGDPIEVEALTKAFRTTTGKKQYCAIGSVKTNVGHLDAAAGVAGFIKAVLAVERGIIPPSLHFTKPNPAIRIDSSPFFVAARLLPWQSAAAPRRAAVNSFGIGGTNAHVIVEQAPGDASHASERPRSDERPSHRARAWQVLPLSARTDRALETLTTNLSRHLAARPDLHLADVARTLQTGRRALEYRSALVSQDTAEAAALLASRDAARLRTGRAPAGGADVVFLFTGQGSQYVSMGRGLYEREREFRRIVDSCCGFLQPLLDLDLREVLYPKAGSESVAHDAINQTIATQPALFVLEYALARLLTDWGIRPSALMGHSVGELAAACVADVLTVNSALRFVAARARLIQGLPRGAMLSVFLPEEEVLPLLGEDLEIAAVNGPSLCVVSGPRPAVAGLRKTLESRGIGCRPLQTSHAFHSRMMMPALDPFLKTVKELRLQAPRIPIVSSMTGKPMTDVEAQDPMYWTGQIREPVRFSDGLEALFARRNPVFVEIGPGRTLSSLASGHPGFPPGAPALSTIRDPRDPAVDDRLFLMTTVGRLWVSGASVDWAQLQTESAGKRVPLPTYPFERERLWVEPDRSAGGIGKSATPGGATPGGAQSKGASSKGAPLSKKADPTGWLSVPSWARVPLWSPSAAGVEGDWVVFSDIRGLGDALSARLRDKGARVITVRAAAQWRAAGRDDFELDVRDPESYVSLISALQGAKSVPSRIVHLWGVTPPEPSDSQGFEILQLHGFYSLLYLIKALGARHVTHPLQLHVVASGLFDVTGEEIVRPEKATALGICKVIPQEYPSISARCVDVPCPDPSSPPSWLAANLEREILSGCDDPVVAYRGRTRWSQTFEPVPAAQGETPAPRVRRRGTYLITGGLGAIGLTFARHLARTAQARLVLTGRTAAPPRESWDSWLAGREGTDAARAAIRSLKSMEEQGAEVLVMRADAADEAAMRSVMDAAEQRFGRLDGVIHAAGLIGGATFQTIVDASREDCEEQFRPKVHGLLTLDKVLRGRSLDFRLMTSSLSSILGGLGFSAYAAANSFLDAFATCRGPDAGDAWTSVNWDSWQQGKEDSRRGAFGDSLARLAMTPQEGVEVLDRILSMERLSQVVVSTADLSARLKQYVQGAGEPGALQDPAARPARLHPRPHLSTPYQEPGSETDRAIVRIWEDLLGIEGIGVNDNFFELGGHSLLATQMISRLRRDFHVNMSLRTLFDAPTIAGLAPRIEEELISEIEKLSEEEAQRSLASGQ